MNAPIPDDPHTTERITAVLQWAAAAAVALGSLYAFLEKIAKPYSEWRRVQRDLHRTAISAAVRETLAVELAELEALRVKMEGCFERSRRGWDRQDIMFLEHDDMLVIISDTRDRVDEIKALLDASGFSAERRDDTENDRRIAGVMEHAHQVARDRRRSVGDAPT